MKRTVFYSWQSDLANRTNRGFIERCLEKAIKETVTDSVNLEVAIDRDTKNSPGTVDISKTIFDKIQNCCVFVADVSIINSETSNRKSPNPNVLIELGYAAKAIGWNNIICVFNLDYGKIDDLPFDIRFRRILPYRIVEANDKKEAREVLSKALRNEILVILQSQKVSNEILEHIKVDLDKEMFSIGRMIEKILYGYSETGSLDRFYTTITIDEDLFRRELFERTFLGFQILKDYTVEKRRLEEKIQNPFLINNLPQEWVNGLLKVIRSLELAELYNSQGTNFSGTGKKDEKYMTINGSELNPENPANRFILLERIEKGNSVVRDSGQFRQYHQHLLIDKIRVAENFKLFSDGLHNILRSLNNWVEVTGGYMLIDPATHQF